MPGKNKISADKVSKNEKNIYHKTVKYHTPETLRLETTLRLDPDMQPIIEQGNVKEKTTVSNVEFCKKSSLEAASADSTSVTKLYEVTLRDATIFDLCMHQQFNVLKKVYEYSIRTAVKSIPESADENLKVEIGFKNFDRSFKDIQFNLKILIVNTWFLILVIVINSVCVFFAVIVVAIKWHKIKFSFCVLLKKNSKNEPGDAESIQPESHSSTVELNKNTVIDNFVMKNSSSLVNSEEKLKTGSDKKLEEANKTHETTALVSSKKPARPTALSVTKSHENSPFLQYKLDTIISDAAGEHAERENLDRLFSGNLKNKQKCAHIDEDMGSKGKQFDLFLKVFILFFLYMTIVYQ